MEINNTTNTFTIHNFQRTLSILPHCHITKMPSVYLLDYVAGNVRSLVNAIEKVGYTVEWIRSPEDVVKADVCSNIFPDGL